MEALVASEHVSSGYFCIREAGQQDMPCCLASLVDPRTARRDWDLNLKQSKWHEYQRTYQNEHFVKKAIEPVDQDCRARRAEAEQFRIQISRASCQVCKTLHSIHKEYASPHNEGNVNNNVTWIPKPEIIARCARTALAAVRGSACCGDAADLSRRLAMCASLIEREALPQAGRWHRRDLVPAATAAWRAVLRAIPSPSTVPLTGHTTKRI
jgi:hypothetical protein